MHREMLGLKGALYIMIMYNYCLSAGGRLLGGHWNVNTCFTFASSKTSKKKISDEKSKQESKGKLASEV